MVTVVVQHVCKDYDAWRPVFDEHATSRSGHGCKGEQVYRSVDDPNAVAVVMEWPSTDAAQGFMSDPSLADAMQRGGVVGPPTITIGEHVEPG